MDKRTKFLKIYADLPLGERSEIVVVVGNEPLSWHAAKLEIEHNTVKGKEVLEILTNLKII
ncbi:hypothetical protein A3E73_01425 [Candidatus Beckwithbacteria bacterium RIFCSPHIGHO2_12_FULL_47_17]|uniref:Uncharacterized protein n=1 Tax=Candidatus Beckwithbacteria bacterium RIFCSPHIGHO2_12_FULL_47_17 TaxID=1797460 RepID=A0A1F5DJL1_9BACT|nr:MAG: hypothetical protein A3E73_01425 [Candidatus Beckwithbacteria bacterium RIFCSPHIGHO2_12_FULL_47_17]